MITAVKLKNSITVHEIKSMQKEIREVCGRNVGSIIGRLKDKQGNIIMEKDKITVEMAGIYK